MLFAEPELVMVVNDLWGASSEASASTLQWAVLYMMKYPGIQTRVQAELDKLGQPHLRLIKQEDRGRSTVLSAMDAGGVFETTLSKS